MIRKLLFTAAAGLVVAACDSGDINISPQTIVENSNNTVNEGGGSPGPNPCATITSSGTPVQGTYDGTNCTYPDVVGAGNNLTTNLRITALPNGGAHIFEGSLFVGVSCRDDACLEANGISQGGDGPTLDIEAGATLAWRTSRDFLVINRGSQIIANGTADAPITLTSVSDIEGSVGPEDVQQWGGVVINGFGVTNACSYTGTRGVDLALAGECHVDSEGSAGLDENQYGGDNDDDSSGSLQYVVVKHTGATVGNGDELNGITFGGVGRGTTVSNIETYSTFDDGIELFGGAVDIENFVAVYVRDDSIDIDEGYTGTITNALVIQSETDGNHCIEADGIGDYDDLTDVVRSDFIARGLNSAPTISNLTCIVSPNGADTATHDPGAGWRLREGIHPVINDALLISTFAENDTTSDNDNYCLRVEDDETIAAATNGDLQYNSAIIACQEPYRDATNETIAADQDALVAAVAATGVTSATAVSDPDLQLLEGTVPVYSIDFATSAVDGVTPPTGAFAPVDGSFLGALSLGETDWTQPWAYGIDASNRGQALFFESL
jgi:hypothetical protein